jgi:L-threonylcarbamoyladenylate synthase
LKLIEISQAKELLIKGDVVAIPTETVYGLAGWIYSETGLKKIFSTKERPFFDPLIVHIDTIEKARTLSSNWTIVHETLAKNCWPGPLTLIAKKNEKINSLITAGLDSVGLRCPRHPETLQLLSQIEGGLAAPSANKFGKTSPTCPQHVFEEFGEEVAILEGGKCEVGIESTVAGIERTNDGWKVLIYRPGHFTASMLEVILEENHLNVVVEYAESPVAPGQLKHHYMPKIPLVITADNFSWEKNREIIEKRLNKSFDRPAIWSLATNAHEASRALYQDLRSFDERGFDIILIERKLSQANENWRGIWNRLSKAKTLEISSNFQVID